MSDLPKDKEGSPQPSSVNMGPSDSERFKRLISSLPNLFYSESPIIDMSHYKSIIHNEESLSDFVNAVFEVIIMDSNEYCSLAYSASVCKKLEQVNVQTEELKTISFCHMLYKKCQIEFEKELFVVENNVRDRKLREIDDFSDTEDKENSQKDFPEFNERFQQKGIKIVRFIGELFKAEALPIDTVTSCLQKLLEYENEISLACVFHLLTIVGKDLDAKDATVTDMLFIRIKEIVDNKNDQKSDKIRSILDDIMDLKKGEWKPREPCFTFSTMAVGELLHNKKNPWAPNNPEGKKIYGKEFLLALRDNPSSKRKPDGFILDAISVEDGKRISEGRHSMGGRSDFTPQFMFGGKSSSQQRVFTKSILNVEKHCYDRDTLLALRNQPSSNEPPSFSRLNALQIIKDMDPVSKPTTSKKVKGPPLATKKDKVVAGSSLIQEDQKLENYEKLNYVQVPTKIGDGLFVGMKKLTNFLLTDLQEIDYLTFDPTKVWKNIASIFAHLISMKVLPFVKLKEYFEEASIDKVHEGGAYLSDIFKIIRTERSLKFLQKLWEESGLKLEDFMVPAEVDSFVEANNFRFLYRKQVESKLEGDLKKLLELFSSNCSGVVIVEWLKKNVSGDTQGTVFIKTLASAIFQYSLEDNKLSPTTLRDQYILLTTYTDDKVKNEVICLCALEDIVNKVGNPSDLLLSFFQQLYEDSIFSENSFLVWEAITIKQTGNKIVSKELRKFLNDLKDESDGVASSSLASEDE